eukprot:TRINITY_DN35123_c0_g1_i1.p1 TRINITY_DN35123_c0_g1~~TRINITY_DN35123_c0_g1_i1.p1  ORF type:complete len:452 (-),score=55.49 TRINITY_DN35123_c0_g1_i1:63-1283(-)
MKGIVKGQLESVLMFVFMAVMWIIGAVSGYLKLIFSVLEHPFSELLDYQQDHLEKGVKEQVKKSKSVRVLKKISSFLGNVEDESENNDSTQQSNGQVDKEVSIPIKSDAVSNSFKNDSQNQSEQISSKQESDAQISNKKSRKSKRKNKKRGEKAHHLSAFNTSQPNEKTLIENNDDSKTSANENEVSTKLSIDIVSSKNNLELTPIQSQISQVAISQPQILQIESPPESPMSADTPLSAEFGHADQRELFMTKYNYQQSSQNVDNFPLQSVEQISSTPVKNPCLNESEIASDDRSKFGLEMKDFNTSKVSIVDADQGSQKLSGILEEKSDNNQQKVKVHDQSASNSRPKLHCAQKSADFEMEELLSHIEVVRMKSQVDPEAIDWYHRNIQILSSIDINSLVKKLHT